MVRLFLWGYQGTMWTLLKSSAEVINLADGPLTAVDLSNKTHACRTDIKSAMSQRAASRELLDLWKRINSYQAVVDLNPIRTLL